MSRRGVVLLLGIVATGLTVLPNAPAAPSKEKTVTLEITGMM
jgi:hypothetical protein